MEPSDESTLAYLREENSRLQHENSGLRATYEALRKEREKDAGHLQKAWRERDEALVQVRELIELLVKRRAMEPEHSHEDHECDECTVLAEMGRDRLGFVQKRKDISPFNCDKHGIALPCPKCRAASSYDAL